MQLQATHVVRAKQVQEWCGSLENFLDTIDGWQKKTTACWQQTAVVVLQSNAIILLPSRKAKDYDPVSVQNFLYAGYTYRSCTKTFPGDVSRTVS